MFFAITSTLASLIVLSAVFFAFRAAHTARTPQGALGWAIFLLSAPFFAVPLYLFLGHHRYRGYLITRRKTEAVIAGLKA